VSERSVVFATNHDMGSAAAMAPSLRKMREMGWRVIVFAVPDSPAFLFFTQASFEPRTPASYGFDGCTVETMTEILRTEAPDLVLVGIAVTDEGSEKRTLEAAIEMDIASAVIVETWPHRWLAVYGERDLPLYRRASLVMVPDEISTEHLILQGFNPRATVATGNPSEDGFAANIANRVMCRRETRERLGISESAIVIQWSMSLDLDDPEQDRPGHSEWMGFSEAESVREFLNAIRAVGNSEVVGIIRQKPTHGSERVRRMIEDICPQVIFDNGPQTGIPMLLASDVVCGAVTMMVQNAAKLGIPGVFYFPDLPEERDPMIANRLNLTIPMYRRGELRELILSASDGQSLVKRLTARTQPIKLPTDATDRVVRAIGSACRT
jgi:hypothetical protein